MASQLRCLARMMPLMVGDKVPKEVPNWENFLLLLKMTELVYTPKCTRSNAVYIESLIDDYLLT